MSEHLCIHNVELTEGGAPEWVHLLPLGTVTGRDGRGPYVLSDMAQARQVIAATLAYQKGADVPVDYDHQLYHAPKNGQPAPASGWIKELQARPDGIWGRVEWTVPAASRIGAKEYRYLSPMFTHDAAGNVLRLAAAGLSNLPNLELTALASQQGDSMEAFLKALAAAFGLAETADQATLTAHAQKLADAMKSVARQLGTAATDPAQIAIAAQTQLGKVALALGQEPGGSVETLVTAAQRAVADKADPKKFVPIDQHQRTANELLTLQSQVAKEKSAALVAAAIADGKVAPAAKEWAMSYASADPEGFANYLKVQPKIVAGGGEASGAKPPGADGKLAAHELAICSQLGISADDFKKTREKEAK